MPDILNLVGNTPVVKLKRIHQHDLVNIYCKLEGDNPGGSIKDRTAYGMIKGAIEKGILNKGVKLVEPTSGNTGIALALIGSLYGIEIELVMPEDATKERILAMKAFGAKITLTPKRRAMEGAIDYARELVKTGEYVMLDQFSNSDNPRIHYETTGPEIWSSTYGLITHFVSAMGTTGTIMGVSQYLKEQNPDVVIVGCQPTDNSNIPGIRKWPEAYVPRIFERSRVDKIVEVSEKQAKQMTKRLAKEEGIFCGMSSGGAVHAALEVAASLDSGNIVCIICDKGDRYLSSYLFE
ncbi:cysteine synthase CysM [Niabella aquatica]